MTNGVIHDSDCAVHNEPAYPAGPCDCGAEAKAQRRYLRFLYLRACTRLARLRNEFRHRLALVCLKHGKASKTERTVLTGYRLLFGIREARGFWRCLVRMRQAQQYGCSRDR